LAVQPDTRRTCCHAVILATACVFWPLCLSGQGTSELLADALSQIRARRLDSAITLLQTITTFAQTGSSEQAEAFTWLGVATFYKGQDSTAAAAFRKALEIDVFLTPTEVLAKLDSGLAVLWESEQTRAVCDEPLPAWHPPPIGSSMGDPMNSEARAGRSPTIVSGPQIRYPDNLRREGIQGRVLARVIIDTLGRAEPRSIRILLTSHPDFNRPVIAYMERARFSVTRLGDRRVRSCVVFPVDFRIKR
jgi:TonB family protein